jgi:UDP-N-acetylmuramoyl-tripeptide--D-alanyl-D-alanine ligase
MLELGTEAAQLHAGLAAPIAEAGVDLVFSCGSLMAALSEALPPALRGGHAADSQALAPEVVDALGPGDVVLVKGSLGSRMAVVVEALKGIAGAPAQATEGK